jgi:hypothetical protein
MLAHKHKSTSREPMKALALPGTTHPSCATLLQRIAAGAMPCTLPIRQGGQHKELNMQHRLHTKPTGQQQPNTHSTATTAHTNCASRAFVLQQVAPASAHTHGISTQHNHGCALEAPRAFTESRATCAGEVHQLHHSTQARHHCWVTHCHHQLHQLHHQHHQHHCCCRQGCCRQSCCQRGSGCWPVACLHCQQAVLGDLHLLCWQRLCSAAG